MGHHFDGIEGAHRRIGGCTASLFHFYDRLLFTTDSNSRPTLILARLWSTTGYHLRSAPRHCQLLFAASFYHRLQRQAWCSLPAPTRSLLISVYPCIMPTLAATSL